MLKIILAILLLAFLAAVGIAVGGVLKIIFGVIICFFGGMIGLGLGIGFIADDEKGIRIIGLIIFIVTLIVLYFIVTYLIIGGWNELVLSIKEAMK